MKKVLILLMLALCFSEVYAQNIRGKIVDDKSQPIAYATVILLDAKDSTFIKGIISGEDGMFSLDGMANDGLLKVSALGYETVFKHIYMPIS